MTSCQLSVHLANQGSAAVDKPARRAASRQTANAVTQRMHAKYSASHHMVIKPFLLLGLAAEFDGGCDQDCCRPSEVYDTHRRTKLTALETISSSRDMVVPAKI